MVLQDGCSYGPTSPSTSRFYLIHYKQTDPSNIKCLAGNSSSHRPGQRDSGDTTHPRVRWIRQPGPFGPLSQIRIVRLSNARTQLLLNATGPAGWNWPRSLGIELLGGLESQPPSLTPTEPNSDYRGSQAETRAICNFPQQSLYATLVEILICALGTGFRWQETGI